MINQYMLVIALTTMLFVSGVVPQMAAASDSDIQAIETLLGDVYPTAINNADVDLYMTLYSVDVLWSAPNSPDQTSKEDIRKAITGFLKVMDVQIAMQVDEVRAWDDHAWAIGLVEGSGSNRDSGDDVAFTFRVMWALGKEDGEWKIQRQLWNQKPGEDQ